MQFDIKMADARKLDIIWRRLAWLVGVFGVSVLIYAAAPDQIRHLIYPLAGAPVIRMMFIACQCRGRWSYRFNQTGVGLVGGRRGSRPMQWLLLWRSGGPFEARLGRWRGLPTVEILKDRRSVHTLVYDPAEQSQVVENLLLWLLAMGEDARDGCEHSMSACLIDD